MQIFSMYVIHRYSLITKTYEFGWLFYHSLTLNVGLSYSHISYISLSLWNKKIPQPWIISLRHIIWLYASYHYWKNTHLYQFVTLICTRYWTGIGSLVMMERICIGRDIRYKCLTFAMGGVLTWYKCALSPLMWQGAFVPRGGTTRNKYSFLFSFMFVFFYVCLL
jgi:hypothetical protein